MPSYYRGRKPKNRVEFLRELRQKDMDRDDLLELFAIITAPIAALIPEKPYEDKSHAEIKFDL
ncbi:MAG: hypothetical protein COU11_03580 [Candidatus Harrisonbacteria bacterium CG10_big_fil_rev_8_21_14_0_10_49_15]|uniref:Uncharacterized protein n=1 Tax=Candidatus Harrisonbacteria bacterium CG10_big_fil_rev_8_21_14_0_10_49_15 TaxID=1974587 RepID=A0A2H0UKH2_9BACT|nr:MAG: hypothetical protein COU11_03580 [Candidatus Harrisonbacteria bacterium CG10_big_fil_rev_8_21_14_0_10_49_15]